MEKEAKKTGKVSAAQRRAALKYQAKKARITLEVFPNEKEMIKEAAAKNNKTIARYICGLVKKDIEKEGVKNMLNKTIEDRLAKYAKEFDENQFKEFADNVGWEDWMNDYTDAKDGEEPTEKELEEIDRILEEIFDKAHEE